MKHIKLSLVVVLMLTFSGLAIAQVKTRSANKSTATGGGFKRFITKTPWTFGISGHVVDDDGNPFKKLFNVSQSWKFLPYPSRFTIDGYYQAGFSFQTEFAYNQYKTGKMVNNEIINTNWTFFSTDMYVKYDLNELIGQTNWWDPYVSAGYGFTLRSNAYGRPTSFNANMGLGSNFWIYENLGFNLQTVAKFSMVEGTSNYLHHSVGVIYKLEGGRGSRPGKLGKRYKFVNKGGRR